MIPEPGFGLAPNIRKLINEKDNRSSTSIYCSVGLSSISAMRSFLPTFWSALHLYLRRTIPVKTPAAGVI